MPNRRFSLIWFMALAAACLVNLSNAIAQSGTIEHSDLPTPPPEIAELLKQAEVRFCYGWEKKPSSAKMPNGRRLDALTVYNMKYDFRTQNRFQRQGSRQQTVTTIPLSSVRLTCEHVVWFREPPILETFWTNRLVLHELDHVRISNDPGHAKLFKKLLSKNATQVRQSSGNESVVLSSQRHAKSRIEAVFKEVTALVDIRYKELDRLTDHGMLELPEGSSLDTLLNLSHEK